MLDLRELEKANLMEFREGKETISIEACWHLAMSYTSWVKDSFVVPKVLTSILEIQNLQEFYEILSKETLKQQSFVHSTS